MKHVSKKIFERRWLSQVSLAIGKGILFFKFKKELCLCCKHLILTLYYTVCYLKIYQINKNKSGKNIPTWIQ